MCNEYLDCYYHYTFIGYKRELENGCSRAANIRRCGGSKFCTEEPPFEIALSQDDFVEYQSDKGGIRFGIFRRGPLDNDCGWIIRRHNVEITELTGNYGNKYIDADAIIRKATKEEVIKRHPKIVKYNKLFEMLMNHDSTYSIDRYLKQERIKDRYKIGEVVFLRHYRNERAIGKRKFLKVASHKMAIVIDHVGDDKVMLLFHDTNFGKYFSNNGHKHNVLEIAKKPRITLIKPIERIAQLEKLKVVFKDWIELFFTNNSYSANIWIEKHGDRRS